MAKSKVTIVDLARMVQNGFIEMKETTQQIVKSEIDKMREENAKHFELIENNQTDLKLRQDNVAYRFELNALDERMTKLEKAQ